MKPIIFLLAALVLLAAINGLQVQQTGSTRQTLDKKQQSIVPVSALTAKGELALLPSALHDGLEAGITGIKIKEVLVYLSAYCGVPRSRQGINTLVAVAEARKTLSITRKKVAQYR